MKDNFELYTIAKEKIYQVEGLVAAFFLLAALMSFASFNPFVSTLNFFILVSIVVLLISGWLYIRRVPTFGENDIGILFAPYGDKAVCEDIERLREELQNRIKSSPYCKRFVLKTLPPNRIISDVDIASMIGRKSRCLLLIWGRYEKGQLQRQELRGFLAGRLNFTYAYPSQLNAEFISKDLKVGIVDRKWMFKSENELIERDFVVTPAVNSRHQLPHAAILFS